MKIVSCSGELQTHELFRIANLVKTKKKINPPKKKNKKSTKKKGKRSLKKEKAMPVMKNSLSAVEKKCSIFRGFFSWTKKILFFFFRLLKEILWIILKRILTWIISFSLFFYVVIYKDITSLTPDILAPLTFKELIDWLLDWRTYGLPESNPKVDPIVVAVTLGAFLNFILSFFRGG